MTNIEEIIDKICIDRGYTRLKVGTIPTWITKDKKEGIELRDGKIKSFWIINSERNYFEPIGEHNKNTVNIINEMINNGKEIEKETQKQQENKEDIEKNGSINTAVELPNELTPSQFYKWEKLRTVERMMMFQRTPASQIYTLQTSKTSSAKYVKGNYMIKEANAAFLFDWKFIQQGISIGTTGVCVYGNLEANIDGKIYSRPAVGYEEINTKMTAQLCIKSATTDAIKKGLSMFGFNSDVYSGEVL